jgi:hypothetical protein
VLVHRWARAGEVGAVAAGVIICVPLYAGWSPTIETIRTTLTTELAQFLIVGVGSIWWLVLCARLPATATGRAYLADSTGEELEALNVATRIDNLTIAGLVLAGLAIGPEATIGKESGPLLASLSAFVAAWAAGFFPDRMSSTVTRDALHWIGLSCLLAAVCGLAVELDRASLGPRVAVFGASLVVGIYSFLHARAHWRTAYSAAPKKFVRRKGKASRKPVLRR